MNEGEWALLGVVIGAGLTGLINFLLQRQQFSHNKEMFFLQNRSGEAVKEILLTMLEHRTHIRRSFETLKKHVGGFSDNEIRQFLHELDAKKTSTSEGKEMWYFLSRSEEFKTRRANTPAE